MITDDPTEAWRSAGVWPLWLNNTSHQLGKAVPPAGFWRWSTMEPLVEAALSGTPDQAERRVLSFIDPAAPPNLRFTTTNLNAGLQALAPGESARPHRHSMNALRFVMSGSGAVTRVDGVSAPMDEGDLVITPGWHWHEHWHSGDAPIVWLDVLDVDLHRHLGTDQFEPGPVHDLPDPVPAEAYRYPLRDALARLQATAPAPDGSRTARYVHPVTGGPVMDLLDCWMLQIPAGTQTTRFRTSSNAVATVVRGSGMSLVGETLMHWSHRDVLALPHGQAVFHEAAEDALLFVCSDREVYRRLGLLKEHTG